METGAAERRRYFTVRDDAGREVPAVEYWAGYFDQERIHEVVPLRCFTKLLWSGEPLTETRPGVFAGQHSGREYSVITRG